MVMVVMGIGSITQRGMAMNTDQHFMWYLAEAVQYGMRWGAGDGATEGRKYVDLKNAWGNGMGYGYSEGQCYGCGNMGGWESYSSDAGDCFGCGFAYAY